MAKFAFMAALALSSCSQHSPETSSFATESDKPEVEKCVGLGGRHWQKVELFQATIASRCLGTPQCHLFCVWDDNTWCKAWGGCPFEWGSCFTAGCCCPTPLLTRCHWQQAVCLASWSGRKAQGCCMAGGIGFFFGVGGDKWWENVGVLS